MLCTIKFKLKCKIMKKVKWNKSTNLDWCVCFAFLPLSAWELKRWEFCDQTWQTIYWRMTQTLSSSSSRLGYFVLGACFVELHELRLGQGNRPIGIQMTSKPLSLVEESQFPTLRLHSGEVLKFSRIGKCWFSYLPNCVLKNSPKLCTSNKLAVPLMRLKNSHTNISSAKMKFSRNEEIDLWILHNNDNLCYPCSSIGVRILRILSILEHFCEFFNTFPNSSS